MSERSFVIIGATGTVGKEVVHHLTGAGCRVLGLFHRTRPAPAPGARDAKIDARDIAHAAAVELLKEGVSGAIDLSGPQALVPQQVAEALAALTGHRVAAQTLSNEQATQAMQETGMPGWLIDRILEFRGVQEAGAAAVTTDGMRQVTGKVAGTLGAFLEAHADWFCSLA